MYDIFGLLYGVLLDGQEIGEEELYEMEEEIAGIINEHDLGSIFSCSGPRSVTNCYIGKIVFLKEHGLDSIFSATKGDDSSCYTYTGNIFF